MVRRSSFIGQGIIATSDNVYRILQVLGEGGNAKTFLAVATSGSNKGIPFAMKVFLNLSKPERRDRFLNEVEFLRNCEHPSIMRVFDDGVIEHKFPFVVAEYLPYTLAEVIKANTATITEKISYTLQLLSALLHLSSLAPPVIHRDIKPKNIFIKGRSCVLGDFGLLKRVTEPVIDDDRDSLKESLGVGMPINYRTPDLVQYLNEGIAPTSKSDVFQAGLVAAELFSGRNPLKPAKRIVDPIEMESLEVVMKDTSTEIASLILRMLELDVHKRDSARMFVDAWQGIFLQSAKKLYASGENVF